MKHAASFSILFSAVFILAYFAILFLLSLIREGHPGFALQDAGLAVFGLFLYAQIFFQFVFSFAIGLWRFDKSVLAVLATSVAAFLVPELYFLPNTDRLLRLVNLFSADLAHVVLRPGLATVLAAVLSWLAMSAGARMRVSMPTGE